MGGQRPVSGEKGRAPAANPARDYAAGSPPDQGFPPNLHDHPSSCYHVACFNIQFPSFISVAAPPGLSRSGRSVRHIEHKRALRVARFVSTPFVGIAGRAPRHTGLPPVPHGGSVILECFFATARRPRGFDLFLD
jgi:hypothetical protein